MRARTTRLKSFCWVIAKSPSSSPRASAPSSEALERRSASTQPEGPSPFASASDLRRERSQEVRRWLPPKGDYSQFPSRHRTRPRTNDHREVRIEPFREGI